LGITSGSKNTGKSSLIKGLALDEIHDETHIIRNNNNKNGI
jgi:predicted AAA+ superfamily ATPase